LSLAHGGLQNTVVVWYQRNAGQALCQAINGWSVWVKIDITLESKGSSSPNLLKLELQ
jgi:hypothetical protein